MDISKKYDQTFFQEEAIRAAFEMLDEIATELDFDSEYSTINLEENSIDINFENTEVGFEEFFSSYGEKISAARVDKGKYDGVKLRIYFSRHLTNCHSQVTVHGPNRKVINKIFRLLDTTPYKSILEKPKAVVPKPVIFLGHGRSDHWLQLMGHLRDKHGIEIVAYETGARSGHTIRDILEDMSEKATMAFLLHTAEDEQADGSFSARPNVIHETGLFQGRLGFGRAIVVLEEGCEEYSNLAGIQQIRYSKGNIKEVFGDVVATIKREFGTS